MTLLSLFVRCPAPLRWMFRRWLRFTWLSRLPLLEPWRWWSASGSANRSIRRQRPETRLELEGLETRWAANDMGAAQGTLLAAGLPALAGQLLNPMGQTSHTYSQDQSILLTAAQPAEDSSPSLVTQEMAGLYPEPSQPAGAQGSNSGPTGLSSVTTASTADPFAGWVERNGLNDNALSDGIAGSAKGTRPQQAPLLPDASKLNGNPGGTGGGSGGGAPASSGGGGSGGGGSSSAGNTPAQQLYMAVSTLPVAGMLIGPQANGATPTGGTPTTHAAAPVSGAPANTQAAPSAAAPPTTTSANGTTASTASAATSQQTGALDLKGGQGGHGHPGGNNALTGHDPPIAAIEGTSYTGTVATFTDSDGNTNPALYTPTITWGDGSLPSGGSVSYANGTFTVSANPGHTYAEEGTYAVSVSIHDSDGANTTVTGTAYVVDAQLQPNSGGNLSATQGQAFNGTLGTFTDFGSANSTADYTVLITWGDGSATSTGVVSNTGQYLYQVAGSHTYQQSGNYTVGVLVSDEGGSRLTWNDPMTVSAPPLPYTAGTPTYVEGASATAPVLATFTDPDNNTDPTKYTATVTWGDGTPNSTGTVSLVSGSTFQITANHGYAEEGSPALSISLTDNADGASETIPVTATVNDATLTATAYNFSTSAGTFYSGPVANFTDADPAGTPSDYTATINWGDGTIATGGVIAAVSGGFQVKGGHTYTTTGSYTVTVSISDAGGATATASSTATVGTPSETLTANAITATEQLPFSGSVATFTPPSADTNGADYSATVGWGDGQQSAGTLTSNGQGGFTISAGPHTYSDETPSGQPYTLVVTVQNTVNSSISPLTSSANATVNDAALTPTGLTLTAWAGAATGAVVAGKFTDANPTATAADFTATISWGDSSPATTGTVQAATGGGFQVVGNHTYTTAGTYTASITVTDDGGQTTTISSTVTVSTATASLSATEGQQFSGTVADFSANLSQVTSASISWGDGSPASSGTAASDGHGGFTVSGVHTYTDEGDDPLSVTVQMSVGGPLTASGSATVNDAALSATGVNLSGTAGQALAAPPAQVVVANFSDTNPLATTADFTASIDWGNGFTSVGTVQANGASFQVLGNSSYPDAGSYTVKVTITDVGGQTATATSTVSVALLEGQDDALAVQVAAPGSAPSEGTTYTASINWGDGSTVTTGAVSVLPGSSPLQLLVSGDHVYGEEGSYIITVTVSDPNNNQSTASSSVTVVDAPLYGYGGLGVMGVAGHGTGQVLLGGFLDSNTLAVADDFNASNPSADYTVSINWGDGSPQDNTSGTVQAVSGTPNSFLVLGSHSYSTTNTYTVTVTVTDDGSQYTTFTTTAAVAAVWSMVGNQAPQRSDDPVNAFLTPISEASVDLNQGALRLSQALDFDQSPGTSVGGDPALVYNSATVDVRPTLQLQVQGDPNAPAPTQAVVQLTWNGVLQTAHTYALSQPAGSLYDFSVQPDNPVASSGAYSWSVTVTFTIPGQNNAVASTSGTAYVVARDGSAYGAGWGIDGITQLVIGTPGVMMVSGQGDWRWWASNGSGGYVQPAEDFGTLVKNGDGTFTYTAVDQTKYNYNSSGYLSSVVDTHTLTLLSYTYDTSNRLTKVTALDLGVTTLSYDPTSGLLDNITEPGPKSLSFSHDTSGNLTQLTDVDNTTRTFTYATPSNHLITQDQWAPLSTSFGYDANNLLNDVNLGLGSNYTIASAASVGANGTVATGTAWASITDGLSHTTKYQLDGRGRLLQQVLADGSSTYSYQRNAAGLVTAATDPLGQTTSDSYDGYGDVTAETRADGSAVQYTYDSMFHHVLTMTQVVGALVETTTNTIDTNTGDLLTSTDPTGAETTYTYSAGLVTSVTTPGPTLNSTVTSYDYYDGDRRLIESTDARGVPTYYSYASAGDVVTTTDALQHSSTVAYNGRNELVATIDADGAVTGYVYEPDGQQMSETNADGFTATTTYDQRGWVSSATDDAGVTTASDQYDAAGNLTQQTDANGDVTTFTYDVDNRQTSMTNALGGVTTDTYNADGEMTSSTDPMNRTTKWTYDGMGRETSTTDPLNRTRSTEYNGVGEVVRSTDAMGVSTLTSYDLDNRAVQTVTAAGGTLESSSTVYNLAGEVVSTTDALKQTRTDSYNVDGEETSSTDPLGFGTSSAYDLVGQLIQGTDANGKVTNYSYDATGRQIGVLDPNNNLTQSVFDALGNEVQSIDARGKVTKTVYDADNRVLKVTDSNNHTNQSFYDKLGNLVQSIDANGKSSMTLYDALSRPFLSEDPNGHWTQTSYDGDGEAQASVDGAGDLTQYGYDGDGEQTSVRNGDGGITLYTYNNDGQTTSETDAVGNVTAYQLDGFGNVVATASAASGLTQSVYDANNRVVSTTDALNRKITYAYDHDGRLTTETWYNADGSVANTKTYTYDHNGNLLTAGDSSGTYTMTYDNAGRLLTRKDPNNLTLTYGYDQNGNVTSVADSLGGSITNVYDPASQLTSVQFSTSTVQARLDLAYTNDGQVSTLKRYKDTAGTQLVSQSAYSYDSTGNVTEIKHTNASGGVLGDYRYTVYDAANRLSSETDTENGGAPVTTPYSYDAASQLTQAGPIGYSYDLNGNRNMTGYSTGSGNQLTSDGTWNYTYDAAGNTHTKTNIATGETWTFTWNNANQLTQAVDKDGLGNLIQTVTLKYDVFGNLIEEDVYTQSTGLTATTKYAYDAAGNVWADLSSTGQLVMRRLFVDVNGQVQPFARIDASGNVAWYLTDHLGSVRLLTDNTATVLDQIDYDAWGNITTETAPTVGDRFKFASGVWDANLGMTRFGVRLVANGHWFSVDPSGLEAGPNPYDYLGNAPTNAIDPTGLISRRVRFLTEDQLKQKGLSQLQLEWVQKENSRYAKTPEQIIRAAGLTGPWDDYSIDTTRFVDKDGKPVEGPSGKPVETVLIRNLKTGKVERVGWQMGFLNDKGEMVTYGYEFFDTAQELIDNYKAYIGLLKVVQFQLLPFIASTGVAVSMPEAVPQRGRLAPKGAKTAEDFLPAAQRRLEATKAKYPGMEGIKGMAISRAKALERLEGLTPQVEAHLAKIARNPNHSSIPHWSHEVSNWLDQMEAMLPHVGKKTAADWAARINQWRQALPPRP